MWNGELVHIRNHSCAAWSHLQYRGDEIKGFHDKNYRNYRNGDQRSRSIILDILYRSHIEFEIRRWDESAP